MWAFARSARTPHQQKRNGCDKNRCTARNVSPAIQLVRAKASCAPCYPSADLQSRSGRARRNLKLSCALKHITLQFANHGHVVTHRLSNTGFQLRLALDEQNTT